MKRFSDIVLIVIVAMLVSFAVQHFSPSPSGNNDGRETTFDRVIRTSTIRCGYAIWDPSVIVDPNTKEISGYSHDVAEAIGEKLGLHVEWVEETGWGVAEQGLAAGRYDMVCADVALDAQRVKAAWPATPIIHNPNYAFLRADDHRFDQDMTKLNQPTIKFAVLPNTLLDFGVREKFPEAARMDVGDLQGSIDVMMAVVMGKADASLNMLWAIDKFNHNNPDKPLKIIGDPVRYSHGAFLLPKGDMAFKQMIDSAIYELNGSGRLREIILKYMPDDKRYWRAPALPYEE